MSTFAALLGETIIHIEGAHPASEEIVFTLNNGKKYRMYHRQDCCEAVSVTDVEGDPYDLLWGPLLQCEEVSQVDPSASESGTWTFYKLGTIKGRVTIRWYGESNGYYSETVDFEEVK